MNLKHNVMMHMLDIYKDHMNWNDNHSTEGHYHVVPHITYKPHHEKTCILHICEKQRRRSAVLPCKLIIIFDFAAYM